MATLSIADKINRSSVLLICLMLFYSSGAQFRQVFLDSAGSDNTIHKISFFSPNQGYIASDGSSGAWIGYTSDSGHTFSKKYITLTNVNFNGYSVDLTFGFAINGVKAFNRDSLIAYGAYGLVPSILYSVDGGNTFKLVFHNVYSTFQLFTGITDLVFPQNNALGFAIDADRILKTTDKGFTWSPVYTGSASYFTFLDAPDNNNVYAFNQDTKAIKITNGNTWTQISVPNSGISHVRTASFISPTKGWICMQNINQDGEIYYTSNGGGTWTQKNNTIASPFICNKMKFVNDSTGYAIGNAGYDVYKTTDSGRVWELLPRDNRFSYLYYGNRDIQAWNKDQVWVGGGRNFLQLTTNGGGQPFPRALFRADTSGLYLTNTVNLLNYSRRGYQYQWFVNNAIVSTAYNASYQHNPMNTHDSVMLVVSNGTFSDTLLRHLYFDPPVVITSFTPTEGAYLSQIVINGQNFTGATKVYFGGVLAYTFTVVSSTKIVAYVGNGATGDVVVFTPKGNASLSGFTFYPPPGIDLPVSVSKSILCKGESITVTIQNTEQNIRYDFVDSLGTSYGFATGTNGTISFTTSPISKTGNYKIKATRTNVTSEKTFTNSIFLLVEHTTSAFTTNRINVSSGEKLNYYQHSTDALSFHWVFGSSASIQSSTSANPPDIFYTTPGQKTLTLMSVSANGCKDTLTANAVFVYTKPLNDAVCFNQNVDDSDWAYYPYSPTSFNRVTLASDNGFYISGTGNQPKLKSRIGNDLIFKKDGLSYFAKYSANGVLEWCSYINPRAGFTASAIDKAGNVYITGYSNTKSYLFLPNGDSLKISETPNDSTNKFWDKTNGFILKLDSSGKYIWHTVLEDPTPRYIGYPLAGGFPTCISIFDNRIILGGTFLANLSYYRNGVSQQLVALPNSTSYSELQNTFVLSIRNDGSLVWNTYNHNTASNQMYKIGGVGLDKNGNGYILGGYEQLVNVRDAKGSVFELNAVGTYNYNTWLMKVDSLGVHQWHASYKASNPMDLQVDSSGYCYISASGEFVDDLKITNNDNSLSTFNITGYQLLKFNPAGKINWAVGTLASYSGAGLSVTQKGNRLLVIATADYRYNSVSHDCVVFTSTDSVNICKQVSEPDFLIAQYDTSGVLQSLINSGMNDGGHLGANKLIVDQKGNYIISGLADHFNGGTGIFNVFSGQLNTNQIDGFFSKVNSNFCYADPPPVANAGPDRIKCAADTSIIGTYPVNDYYTYSWTSYPSGFYSAIPTPLVKPIATTKYFLTVMSPEGLWAKDTVTITVLPHPIADAGPDKSICLNTSTTIGTTAIQGYSYSWTSNPSGFSSTIATPAVMPLVSTSYYVTATNNNGCTWSDTVLVTVGSQKPSVDLSGSSTFCSGFNASYLASPFNGGDNPSYHWQVNGLNVGTNSSRFSTTTLKHGDVVNVTMTSSLACAIPASVSAYSITVTVLPNPAVSLTSSATSICAGASATLTATGGSSYNWSPATGLNTTTGSIVTASPTVSTTYVVKGNSTNSCSSSDSVRITVSSVVPTISISGSACNNASIVFTATTTNGGTNPIIEWFVNNTLTGSGTSYTLTNTVNGTKVFARLSSNANCATPSVVNSDTVTVNCTVTAISDVDGVELFRVTPNPTQGLFIVSMKLKQMKKISFVILDPSGRKIYNSQQITRTGDVTYPINLTGNPSGMYYLQTFINNKIIVDKILLIR